MKKDIFPAYGADTYPSATAGHGEQIGITPWRRCVQCGLPNDTRATATSRQGDGLIPQENGDEGELDVGSGCRFCGSLMWIYPGSAVLPDDEFLPTPEVVRDTNRKRR